MDPAIHKKPCRSRIFRFLSGFWLACVLFLLLLLLTWFATLEQKDLGIYPVIRKYFSSEAFFVIPEINGHTVPLLLPGAYWVCVLLSVNILCGGIIRLRKGWKSIGVLIAHSGMLLLLAGGAVTHHFSKRGRFLVWEGQSHNIARSSQGHAIEITEITPDGSGKPLKVHVIPQKHLKGLENGNRRLFRMRNLPFDIEIEGYHSHCQPIAAAHRPPENGELVIDGYYLRPVREKGEEGDTPGCYFRLLAKNGGKKTSHILWDSGSYSGGAAKLTAGWEGRKYLFDLCKAVWQLPFEVALKDFRHEYHPGTRSPRSYESEIIRRDDSGEQPALIKMNQPLRYKGYTLFQTNFGPLDRDGRPNPMNGKMFSVFETVHNPADQWPAWALYISGLGLLLHFGIKLARYLRAHWKGGSHA